MCHGKRAERGDLWEPNLKHCHDGSWKCVKVGGSVIFKDEPRGKAERKAGSDTTKEGGRRRRGRRMRRRGGGGCRAIFIRTCHFLSPSSQAPLKEPGRSCCFETTAQFNMWVTRSAPREKKNRAGSPGLDGSYSPSSKKLHPQQSKHHNEEEEEEEQADNGLHGAHEGNHQVPERGPVSDRENITHCLPF